MTDELCCPWRAGAGRAASGVGRIVAGFPTRDEAATLGRVMSITDEGLEAAGLCGVALFVNADNGSQDGTSAVFASFPARVGKVAIATGAHGTGKGTNLLAIFHAALDLGADRVVVLDGDVRSGAPWWLPALLGAADYPEPAIAVPVYRRDRYEGNTTNHVAAPLLAAVLGTHVQQPIAGDFAFNRQFIEKAVTWPLPESAQLYGIDIFLTGNAAREGFRITEVPLGRKIHNPGFPKIIRIGQQVIDTIWHLAWAAGKARPTAPPSGRAPRSTVDGAATRPDRALTERTFARVRRYIREHAGEITVMFPVMAGNFPGPSGDLPHVGAAMWADILASALAALAGGHGTAARDHLVALYLCRVATYWQEIEELADPAAIDELLDRQAALVTSAVARGGPLRFMSRPPMAYRPGPWTEGHL